MLYVDGTISSLSGPSSGAAIQNGYATTVTAATKTPAHTVIDAANRRGLILRTLAPSSPWTIAHHTRA